MIALRDIRDRVALLSHREQVRCMAIACADAMPVWEEYAAREQIDYRQVNSALFAGLKGERLTGALQAYADAHWSSCCPTRSTETP